MHLRERENETETLSFLSLSLPCYPLVKPKLCPCSKLHLLKWTFFFRYLSQAPWAEYLNQTRVYQADNYGSVEKGAVLLLYTLLADFT